MEIDELEKLNNECMRCQDEARKKFQPLNPSACRFCPIGQRVHELEVKSSSQWNEVDWNSSKVKPYYHG